MKLRLPFSKKRSESSAADLVGLVTGEGMKVACLGNYRPVAECPQVQMCVSAYADRISSMTIHLMKNGKLGDTRIKNPLSRKLDIEPCRNMTRQQFIWSIVYGMLLHGNSVVVPSYKNNLIDDLMLLPPDEVTFQDDHTDPMGYTIMWRGIRFKPDEVLHFVWKPDPRHPYRGLGYTVPLWDIVSNVRQANATRKALLESPAPSIIVKVDGLSQDFASKEGRENLAAQYLSSSEKGQPWFIPAEAFSVDQVKPLTMTDLAIKDSLELDKKAMAAIFGVPNYYVGIGEYHKEEQNGFVRGPLMTVAKVIEQEFTRKLLFSKDLYWRFNSRSLMAYDINEITQVGTAMLDRVALSRNELRDWLGFEPREDMEEMLALENYVPAEVLGSQKKLVQDGGEE